MVRLLRPMVTLFAVLLLGANAAQRRKGAFVAAVRRGRQQHDVRSLPRQLRHRSVAVGWGDDAVCLVDNDQVPWHIGNHASHVRPFDEIG